MSRKGKEKFTKINLFIFYCGVRTGNFGSGSHIHRLISFFKNQEIINLTIINTDDREVEYIHFEEHDNANILHIPQPENKLYLTASPNLIQKRYAKRLTEVIYPFLKNVDNPIFLVNSIDYLNLSEELMYSINCKVLYIHHAWTWKELYNIPDKVFEILWRSGDSKGIEKAFEFTQFQQKIAKIADRVITVTQQAKKFYSEVLDIPARKITTIYNGIAPPSNAGFDSFLIRQLLGIRSEEQIILYTGRIKEDKGLTYLLEAFKILSPQIPDARLVLIGSGDFNNFISLSAPFWAKVTFTGKLSPKDVLLWYQIADIGVLPSLHEQCSFTAIEMRFNKIPLIVSSVDGLDEMFTHNVDSLKLSVSLDSKGKKTLDVNELKCYMVELLKHKELANRLSFEGYKVALDLFTLEKMCRKYLSVIKKMNKLKI